MSRQGLKRVAAAVILSSHAVVAFAADELVIYAFEDGAPATGVIAALDGETRRPVDADGSVAFDLGPGAHAIVFTRGGETLHTVRFNAANGQFVDINVALDTGEAPKVAIESYFATETARDRAQAPKGGVGGRVSLDGAGLAGARVAARGTGISVQTDAAGRYELQLPRGIYQIEVTHPDLPQPELREVRVVSNVDRGENLRLGAAPREAPTGGAIEEVVSVAKFQPTAFGESERFSTNVLETIGLEELARFGDSDVAASVVRVPSVTVQDDRFIFIRGLGGRYITTTLNGATLPSTDPTKREVPLDLFPANLVKQLDIKKSFIASMPGESTGGNLVINTRTFPEEAAGKLSFSLGYTSDLTGDKVFADPADGSWDVFGWDDGSRKEPPAVAAIASLFACQECFDDLPPSARQELSQVAGLLLQDNLDLDTATATPKVSLGLNYGDVYDVGGNEFGFFVAGNYKNGWSQKESGISRTYEADGDVADDFSFEEYSNNIDANGLIALGFNTRNSSYKANTIVSRSTQSKVKVSDGIEGDERNESYRYTIDWIERQFLAQQLAAEHTLGPSGAFIVDWQVTGSQARRYAPDRREVRFDLTGGDDIFNLEVPSLVRRYDDLTDDNIDASVDLEYLFDSAIGESTVSFGLQTISRERDSDSASYGYSGGQTAIDDNAPNLRVDDVIHTGNITGNPDTGYTFQNKTLPSDSYDAELTLNSAYLSYDLRFARAFQVILGARYEDYEQITDTFSLAGAQPAVQSRIDEGIVLPTLSFNWDLTNDQKLRLAATKTVSRPDFKETSNATFYDTEFDFRVRGNPLLKVSEVMNYDLRWELYWSDEESVSVALFYKDLDDPIERVVQPASGTAGNSRTFQNADSAELYGVELDGRIDFDLNRDLTRSLFVALNASYIDSEVELINAAARKLQGQPDYTFNLAIGYDDFASKYRQELTALVNTAGDTIVDVGISGQPDIILEPRLSVDLNYKLYFNSDFVFRTRLRNLLDSDVEFTQGGQVFQKYNRGVELEAGIDWNF